ncbi:hypothetical protein AMTR_s00224p00028340 [Amborella trichopoda]|uniref:Uncharacterized protein n=1 Tax=Amborella trichopoda TaxID=13333 RepID=W1P4A8_AMBTC|nr:hypothetical protein AMTR_s00224p00028340 [Amborella trichopoda]
MALWWLKNSGQALCSLENYQASTTAKHYGVIHNHSGAITQQSGSAVTGWVSPTLDRIRPAISSGSPAFGSLSPASNSLDTWDEQRIDNFLLGARGVCSNRRFMSMVR